MVTLAAIEFNCLCGTPLTVRFLQALRRHPMRAYRCPNRACRYEHRFLLPNVVRTALRYDGQPQRDAAFPDRLLRPPATGPEARRERVREFATPLG